MCCSWHGPKLSCTIPTYIFYRTTTQYTLKHGGLHRHIHPHNQAPGMNPATPAASTSSSTMGVCHSAVAIAAAAAAAQLPIGGRCTADDLQLPLVDCSPRRYILSSPDPSAMASGAIGTLSVSSCSSQHTVSPDGDAELLPKLRGGSSSIYGN